ncbi:DUF3606 domain-containing protein [Bordetella genomosp. 9]|uniref:DUF3606 domain-containing protein n=1 Tax=Bordetella genomosp. 9 TaxID=1416803 RepID=A0A1W6Z1H2_9BORD|nr:DUF3606 domain-containing protein [Bordetella genomosp. 9]ARP87178.1 DUF3606 domain-containing protein [Bordetella genomosp. 9]ARP91165.1 DUF3606 domain-containing protein [Bordetella genomosp. 9]
MADDLKDRGPRDRSRINLEEDWEVRYWSETLGCTRDELRKAVQDAGTNSVDKVREFLKK